jgi:arginase family enzyme
MQVIKVPGINGADIGCARAGNAIIEELGRMQTNESGKTIDKQLLDLEEIHLDNSNLKLTNKLIYENSIGAYGAKPRVFFLGGDHSVTYSLFRGFASFCNQERKRPCLIVFDSRPNIKHLSGDFPTNEEWLRGIFDSGISKEDVLLVGARHYSTEENNFIKEIGVKIMNLNNLETNIEDACDTIMEFADRKELYVSIDLSVADSAFAPSTTFNDAGGMTARQLIYLLQRVNKMKNLRAIDLVEVNVEEDKQHKMKTIKLAAKILSEFL